jgi:hypothetical protein
MNLSRARLQVGATLHISDVPRGIRTDSAAYDFTTCRVATTSISPSSSSSKYQGSSSHPTVSRQLIMNSLQQHRMRSGQDVLYLGRVGQELRRAGGDREGKGG